MKLLSSAAVATLLLAMIVFPDTQPSTSTGAKANGGSLLQLEGEFMKAAAEKGAEGYMSYYADDAVELPNQAAILKGKENIAKTMGFLNEKDNHLAWTPVGADMSASGDLGYTYGTYEFRSTDKNGHPTVEFGKYTTVWKKQKDGRWKVVLDMGNSSPRPKL